MSRFLDCEIAEMAGVRADVGEEVFNRWFDKSEIKGRLKKVCMDEQGLRCCYCRKFDNTTNNLIWDLEHVLCELYYPQFFASDDNLAVACKRCNNAKKHEDVLRPQPRPDPRIEEVPQQPECYSIPHPRFDAWSDHLSHVNYQIYSSDTDKGVELMRVCKLNEPAVDQAGLDHESVVAAIKTQFFQIVDNAVSAPPPDEEILVRMARGVQNLEDERAAMTLAGLAPKLRALGRKAGRRNMEQSIAEARALAAPPAKPPKEKISEGRALSLVASVGGPRARYSLSDLRDN
ncbi:hypothetical protein [Sphingopyxis panaciterrulae]|uniref:HNH domain-containing protein n=2 Tax=Sphingopyxis TaxID=165697 RepID=A0A7W9B987_9SPHN|nr:hypothetical protein [Sphingopyxis panaciterrulae]MBB5708382.1 hypothetical protein [Sphingopyxis panaciterrulae]SBV32629.1 protein of unknown function [uncultured Sphingopyxis sp.]